MDTQKLDACLDVIERLWGEAALRRDEYVKLHTGVTSLNDAWAEHVGKLSADLAAYRQAEQDGVMVRVKTTTYTRIDSDSSVWNCKNCGAEWCLEDGTPVDNGMTHCPQCGAKITSVIDRYFDYEADDYAENELMPQESDRAALQEVEPASATEPDPYKP